VSEENDPNNLTAAVAPPAPPKRIFKACFCGAVPEGLILEMNKESKIGKATCGTCCTWGLDFLRGIEHDPEKIMDKAQAAWDAGPRPG